MSEPSIVIVEADVLVRHPLAEYLRECGYKVIEASDGDDARAILGDSSVSVDIVLIDIEAGGESGFSLARSVRAQHPAVDVVLAGTVGAAVAKAGDLCEEGPRLSKPYDHRLVLQRIRQLRARRERSRKG